MVFSDLFFLFVFIPAFVVCYLIAGGIDRLCRRRESGVDGEVYCDDICEHRRSGHLAKNIVLIVFSLIFYAWGEPVYVFLMLVSVLLNYCVGRGIGHCGGRGRRVWLVLGVVMNLSILYIPVHILPCGRVQARVSGSEEFLRAAALHIHVPAAYSRPDSALQHCCRRD